MAAAVSLWSPVIITGRMPAARQRAMAAAASGRTGSIMPTRPMNTSCLLYTSYLGASVLEGFFTGDVMCELSIVGLSLIHIC